MPTVPLSEADVDRLRKEFAADPTSQLLQNALTSTDLKHLAVDRAVSTGVDHVVSHRLDDWKVTNQRKSGRCWLFAGLNLLRAGTAARLGVKDFEFSQNHAMFFDKFERANYFLQSVVELVDRPTDDRTVATLLQECLGDGGQWNMFVAVVAKHGLVPQSVMPESHSSSATADLNSSLRQILHTAAHDLRSPGADHEALVESTLGTVWRALCLHLGTPPESFEWQWRDDEKVFHRDGVLTPQEFRDRYLTVDLDDYVCLVHDPRASSPEGRTFTVDLLGNVVGAPPVVYLNVGIDLIRKLTADQIVAGQPVWFGCDVGQQMDGDRGVWDARLLDLGPIYDFDFHLDKAARLEYHQTLMTHAMLFTGVDLDAEGTPRRWRVENSWGPDRAVDGFQTMADSWFDEYVFEIAAPRSLLPAELLPALEDDPIVLPAWDPMGALAR